MKRFTRRLSLLGLASVAAFSLAVSGATPASASVSCATVEEHYYGPLVVTSSENAQATDFCRKVQLGTWWRGTNGAPDRLGVLSVPYGKNKYLTVLLESQFGELLGSSGKAAGRVNY